MTTFPGINRSVVLNHFDDDETRIINFLARDWYVTNGGGPIIFNRNSRYKFFFIKPTRDYVEMFNIEREVVCVFSSYNNFEPRTLDAFEYVFNRYPDLRLENICCILISKDRDIKQKVSRLLKGDPESRVIIPFTYEDFYATNTYFIKSRFRSFFYERDLFAFESPITRDYFFFGRSSLIHKMINRHKSKENSGLFGLRKTGKTSVINGIYRALKTEDLPSVIIDCQDTSFNQRRWFKALHFIIRELKKQNKIKCLITEEIKYTEENASLYFEKDLIRISKKVDDRPILLIFDEIENISPFIAPNENWREKLDFVLFWQTIRSKFQKFLREYENTIFTFLIVGTNPRAIEIARVNSTDNPIFNKVPFEYIEGFTVSQTSEMLKRLGGYMGLEFDDVIFGKLREDFGGHPYLMRHVCSIINEVADNNRPTKVDKTQYEKAKALFSERYSHYFEMILEVLEKFYPEEYDMLTYLAIGDLTAFHDLANLSTELIAHLKGYGVISENNGNYYFEIELIQKYLFNKNKYKAVLNSTEDRWKEISERRNKLETKMRQLLRMQMQITFGKTEAFSKVTDILGAKRKDAAMGMDYNDLFDPNKIELYFNDLIKIILKYYDDIFKNIFGRNKDETKNSLEIINKYRSDAHAKDITKEEMDYFRVNMQRIENIVYDFI